MVGEHLAGIQEVKTHLGELHCTEAAQVKMYTVRRKVSVGNKFSAFSKNLHFFKDYLKNEYAKCFRTWAGPFSIGLLLHKQ